jgi:glycosyltransferase involved in cell wall biosynthesis
MQNDPKVVVLIPYYDDIDGLYRSIDSIKEELLVDIVIVDDGSKIKPDEINLKSKYKNVHDIFLITLTENKGIENALNEGLAFIKRNDNYKYIARLDLEIRVKRIEYQFSINF